MSAAKNWGNIAFRSDDAEGTFRKVLEYGEVRWQRLSRMKSQSREY